MFTQSYDVNWIEIDERQSFPQFSSLLPVCRVLEFLYTIHSQTREHTHSHTHISSGVTLGWRLYTEAEILLCRGLLKCHLSNSSSHVYAERGGEVCVIGKTECSFRVWPGPGLALATEEVQNTTRSVGSGVACQGLWETRELICLHSCQTER